MSLSWKRFCLKHRECRRYRHFDYPCSLESSKIRSYVCNPKKIAAHSFYPFVQREQLKKRFAQNDQGIEELPPKVRHICICSHLDRCVYQRYAYLIGKQYELYANKHGINEVAIAYRRLGKSNIDFAKKAMDFIEDSSSCLVFVSDFSDFFDRINHRILKERLREVCLDKYPKERSLPMDIYAIYKNITRYSFIHQDDIGKVLGDCQNLSSKRMRCFLEEVSFSEFKPFVHKNKNMLGIPQGSPISAMLSNIYMSKFDISLKRIVQDHLRGMYMRYSDDIIVIIPATTIKEAAKSCRIITSFFRKNREIAKISKSKTKKFFFENGKFTCLDLFQNGSNLLSCLDYLGFRFDGISRRIKPSSSDRYLHKSRRSAIAAGKQLYKEMNSSESGIFFKNLYDRYSTCSKKARKLHPQYKNRSKRNYLAYVRRARDAKALQNDVTSENILVRSKDRLRKFIQIGIRKAQESKMKARLRKARILSNMKS